MTDYASLLALSPLDGRYQNKCQFLSQFGSEYALNKYRLMIEVKWLQHIAKIQNITLLPPLTPNMESILNNICDKFDIANCQRIKEFEIETNHDVKSVEYYLKEQLSTHNEFTPYLEFIHFACTSEDINNLSYALMLKDLTKHAILPQLNQAQDKLAQIAQDNKNIAMLARTHGQSASPTTLGKEFANVHFRIKRQMKQLKQIEILGKINGAVGNFNAHVVSNPNIDWSALSENFVTDLGLTWNPMTTQIEPHDYQAELYHCLSRINTIFIDLSRDIWSYISIHYFKQLKKDSEVGSSTMPHKVNPIDFENAEGNFGLSNALLHHLAEKLPISRWQRDLTDSTVQRNIGVAIGYHSLAMQSLLKGLNKLEVNTDVIKNDLNQHWEVLGEAIQTVLRKYQVPNAYEKLKTFSRGKDINANSLADFIETLELPAEVKDSLKKLTPEKYTGLAQKLVEDYFG